MNRALIAILRGVKPTEVVAIADALIEAGIHRIEVPLNSPDAFDSIERLVLQYGTIADIGAGTVLTIEAVERLASIGARMVVSPNCNSDVIRATKSAGMASYPGVLSPTECFNALEAGADALKFFPSFILGPTGVSAIKSVLPENTKTYAVGGVGPENFAAWMKAGITGFGVGSSLYKPGWTTEQVSTVALQMVAAFDACVN